MLDRVWRWRTDALEMTWRQVTAEKEERQRIFEATLAEIDKEARLEAQRKQKKAAVAAPAEKAAEAGPGKSAEDADATASPVTATPVSALPPTPAADHSRASAAPSNDFDVMAAMAVAVVMQPPEDGMDSDAGQADSEWQDGSRQRRRKAKPAAGAGAAAAGGATDMSSSAAGQIKNAGKGRGKAHAAGTAGGQQRDRGAPAEGAGTEKSKDRLSGGKHRDRERERGRDRDRDRDRDRKHRGAGPAPANGASDAKQATQPRAVDSNTSADHAQAKTFNGADVEVEKQKDAAPAPLPAMTITAVPASAELQAERRDGAAVTLLSNAFATTSLSPEEARLNASSAHQVDRGQGASSTEVKSHASLLHCPFSFRLPVHTPSQQPFAFSSFLFLNVGPTMTLPERQARIPAVDAVCCHWCTGTGSDSFSSAPRRVGESQLEPLYRPGHAYGLRLLPASSRCFSALHQSPGGGHDPARHVLIEI